MDCMTVRVVLAMGFVVSCVCAAVSHAACVEV